MACCIARPSRFKFNPIRHVKNLTSAHQFISFLRGFRTCPLYSGSTQPLSAVQWPKLWAQHRVALRFEWLWIVLAVTSLAYAKQMLMRQSCGTCTQPTQVWTCLVHSVTCCFVRLRPHCSTFSWHVPRRKWVRGYIILSPCRWRQRWYMLGIY